MMPKDSGYERRSIVKKSSRTLAKGFYAELYQSQFAGINGAEILLVFIKNEKQCYNLFKYKKILSGM